MKFVNCEISVLQINSRNLDDIGLPIMDGNGIARDSLDADVNSSIPQRKVGKHNGILVGDLRCFFSAENAARLWEAGRMLQLKVGENYTKLIRICVSFVLLELKIEQ